MYKRQTRILVSRILSGAGRLGLPIPKSYTFSAPYFSFNLALSVYMLLMAALLSNSLDIFSEIIDVYQRQMYFSNFESVFNAVESGLCRYCLLYTSW